MRTTVRLDPALLAAAKKMAAENGTTLTAIIEDALRERLSRRSVAKRHRRVRFTTYGGKGIQPGVDLSDTAALLDHMERSDAAD